MRFLPRSVLSLFILIAPSFVAEAEIIQINAERNRGIALAEYFFLLIMYWMKLTTPLLMASFSWLWGVGLILGSVTLNNNHKGKLA